ncbi:MAG: dTDP-4-dehydrorhamnose reductase [Robiginitomaculum sp.]|nr:MAG: dTDP-4-dehydrorhamnose reductase [Robiginitomaculum sp.]
MSRAGPLLVVGRSGQLAHALVQAGRDDVIALGRPDLDLCDARSVKRALTQHNPALVINAAAYTAVDKAEADEAAAMALNAEGPAALAALCADQGCPLIHVSTDYVFDGTAQRPYRETDPCVPLGVYGRSKHAGEVAIAGAHRHHIIVRTAWVYSDTGHNFVKTMLHMARDRDGISVVKDQFGNPTFAPHLAEALLHMADHIKADPGFDAWGIYHLAGQGQASWADLAMEVFKVSKALGGPTAMVVPIPGTDYPTPAARPANSCLDGDKAKAVFDVALPDWRDGVKTCVQSLLRDA